ncbi:glucose 1-dehydrogenase [Methylobacterium sp. WL103]|uniref:SDR family NAD(P)-dependent oxidoreductase n=1 Tax=unclassified Methylobacterium TaxID=2615210 RepID=UPI0011CA2B14|nr:MULTISPECIES: glucose 1-dehydrogenase [unclassified Methylobacterium]TXM66030.1 glucose 1-dehydrogenase [Methylobacterium sp. WL120]TXM74986.1 glucose 1-dehydrogenase [Methylobacterium sp. WL12]TXN06060.1 glucose 1-dehydrogenase [Methylobacterium sp. WL103]
MKLEGKKALITGADSGIGRATALLFAQHGADVAITYNTDADGIAETTRLVEETGRRALVIQNDVGDPASVAATFDRVASDLGPLDILVANAGQAMSGMAVADMEDERLERILRVNLMGPLFCARAFIKVRRAQGGRGKIVMVSSVAQHLPTPESAPYGMSKAGVGSLCRSLSRELADDRINVNNVAPGLIETPMTADRFEDPKVLAKSLERIPWHRAGQPDDIAKAILYLSSDDADYVTGHTLVVDGGLTMQWGGA